MKNRCLLLFSLLGLLLDRPAAAQDYAAAGRHFAAAQDAFAQGNFKDAAQQYQASYDITQDPALLFNIGESWQRAGELARARDNYQAYLKAQPSAADQAEVEQRLKSIAAAAPAAPAPEVKTATPQAPAPGQVVKKAAPAAPATAKPSVYRTAAWTVVAGGVALVTAGAILGLGAQNRADEINRRTRLTVAGQPPIYDSSENDAYTTLQSDGTAYNTAAITCFAVAGAAALVGGVLFYLDHRHRQGQGKTERPTLSLLKGPGPLANLGWSF